MWSLKKENDTNELICKIEPDPQTKKTKLLLPKGKMVGQGWRGEINKEFGSNINTQLCIK